MDSLFLILLISIAGPVIGSFIGVMKKPSALFMNNMLSFAAGVMLAISFLELIPEAIGLSTPFIAALGIIAGSLVMYSLDKLIPHIHPELCSQEQGCRMKKTSVYLILGIFLHNFPEGMAIATGNISGMTATLSLAFAIAIHNIPEGICTSAPYFYCTRKRLKSFLLSSSTAVPIVIGFIFASMLFEYIPTWSTGMITAATAGLMIYISSDELIPTACSKNNRCSWSHSTIFSLITGILFVIILGAL